ncbi:complex I assembly factor ACAD9, mitochondrial-like [Mercenaria mercenaria]|uniref:complex I assembly factor ACAD9, mitochondrial-like n=1 Tax=Mercenaria mercenaria TaxID=6596 RepID=UPI00234FB4CD|nr:complex I assembly factor ACAD9, mitochondrial-like [Mercenaria mercenaria]
MFKKSLLKLSQRQIKSIITVENINSNRWTIPVIYHDRCLASSVEKAGGSSITKTEGQDIERSKDGPSKPLKNTPFVKELFLGRFDKEMLVFPELSKSEDYDHLNELVAPIERFFDEAVDSKQIDIDGKIPDEILKHLGELGLFGMQIPEEYGGLELDATKFARLAEITALDGAIAVTLAGHGSIGLKGILIAGTEAQKQKYLPKLASGEHIAAFCLTEPTSGSDAASIQTRATLSEDGQTFHLNGGKIWITNGGIADIFTVFAKTEVTNEKGEKQDKITAFIVEREFGGITSGRPEDKLGIRGSNTCEVHFDNTPVPVENVIGEVGGGFKIAMNILNSGRFSMGSSGAGILKRLIGYTAEHAISRTQFKQKLMEFELIKKKFAQMAVTTYAMESMAYLTALTLDSYEEPDASVEAAMVKIYSSEGCWNCASECLQVLGGLGYMKTYPYERYLRDARILMIFEGTNEILRLYTSLTGMQYAGKELKDLQRKARDPFNNPSLIWKGVKMSFRNMLGRDTRPKMTLNLHEEVHPSLKDQADQLEEAVLRFELVVQKLLVKYGSKIKDAQLELERCANITIDIYAMTACIGRTSRSLCIGLRNSDHEVLLTRLFCDEAVKRINKNFKEIYEGPQENSDDLRCRIADAIFENKGYAATHPLAHS